MLNRKLFDLAANRPVTGVEVKRCLDLLERLRGLGDSDDSEDNWRSDSIRIHRKGFLEAVSIDSEFLNSLWRRCSFFTGYDVTLPMRDEPDFVPPFGDDFMWKNDHEWTISTFLDVIAGLPEELICRPPLLMGEIGFDVGGLCVNNDVLGYQERINVLHAFGLIARLQDMERPVIVEIGGGYGALAHFLKKLIPQATYMIIDLPSSLVYSMSYLAVASPEHEAVVSDRPDLIRPEGQFVFAPDFAVERSNPFPIDLVVNTLSFAEMPAATVERYAAFARACVALRKGVLFEQNFRCDPPGCDPEEIIKRHFDFQIRCRARTRWGRASVWGVTDWFVEGWRWPRSMLGRLGS